MRSNKDALQTIFSSDNVAEFLLVTFNWNSDYYFTDLGRDIVWQGNTYLKNLPVTGIDKPSYTSVVNREAYRFSMSGTDSAMKTEIQAGIIGRPVEFRMLFTVDGVPQLGADDTFIIYKGRVSSVSEVKSDEGKIFQVECTSPLSDLDAIGTIFTTKDGISPLLNELGGVVIDTCFDEVSESSVPTSLKWGKA